MIIIAGNSHVNLANSLALALSAQCIIAGSKKFADQELRIQIDGNLHEQDVVLVQSISKPANDHLMELLLLADTAKRAGARRVTAVIPYFGYSRQDRPSYKYGPISASLVAKLIETSGIDKVITVDLHSRQTEGFFSIGIQNIDPLPLFAPLLSQVKNSIVISPDVGGLPRAQKLAALLGVDLAVINKSRTQDGECLMSEVIGDVFSKNCILVDDIIDTGATLCQAAKLLKQKGAQSVHACVTHAVFSGACRQIITQAGFTQFYTTDTIKQDTPMPELKIISVQNLILEVLRIS